ncbi:methyl-accepting chemotaxis protein [Cohnella thermotolerans]|uniref:methyl-accepting chemotaxis protein n=1 Tax=Cohnella thermotolerans TaxID=329858 RepID=UPI0003F528EA|nr:methyl-accepting chemotaxis protein [Cohnella thermotolerans]
MSIALINPPAEPSAEHSAASTQAEPADTHRHKKEDAVKKQGAAARSPEVRETFHSLDLSEWVRSGPVVSPEQTCGQVMDLFKQRTDLEGVAIAGEDRRPIGLVMKHRFFRSLASQFGVALFGDKPITLLMDAEPLVAELDVPPQTLIDRAMSRPDETLYDSIVVTKGGKTAGLLTIGDLLHISRLLQREAAERQIRTIRVADSMTRNVHAAVEKVEGAADHSRQSSERFSAVAESGRKELAHMLELFRLWSDTARRQEESVAELLARTAEASGIAKLISELADRCNLLAINAQIEAARAGEHGRGFAVVAQEVRALADQTKQSTERINRQLRDMSDAAEQAAESVREGKKGSDEGVRRVQNAESTFGKLWEISSDNLAAAARLTEASREASAVSEQIREQIAKLAAQLNGVEA